MKKILLCFLVLVVGACSNSDDSNSDKELIIGVWKPVEEGEVYQGVPDIYSYSDCEQQGRMTFFANGNWETFDYDHVYDNNSNIIDCKKDVENTNGTWLRINENQIKLTYDGIVEIPDRTRFLDNNTFRIEWDSGDYIKFKRVN